jgi:hypothetical protein
MSISNQTIASVQKAGAALYEADSELKAALKSYSERVTTAVGHNPFDLGNDVLFENLKTLARFSKTVGQIELELQKVHAFVAELVANEPTQANQPLALVPPLNLGATDVVDKKQEVRSSPKAKAKLKQKLKLKPNAPAKGKAKITSDSVSLQNKPTKQAMATTGAGELSANGAKLLTHLTTLLSHSEFTAFNQSKVSGDIGVPLGSMTYAIKQLVDRGRVIPGPNGTYKLA